MVRSKRSTPVRLNAAYGKLSSARWQARRSCRTGCSSTAAASRCTAALAGEKGALAHGIGRTKGGRNTKLHAVCDVKGRPVVLLLTPGNVHDCKVAQRCIEAMPPSAELVADKGYDSQRLREWLEARGTDPVIPPRKNRKNPVRLRQGYLQAAQRHRAHILPPQGLAGIATRFDRHITSFMGAIALAVAVIKWLE